MSLVAISSAFKILCLLGTIWRNLTSHLARLWKRSSNRKVSDLRTNQVQKPLMEKRKKKNRSIFFTETKIPLPSLYLFYKLCDVIPHLRLWPAAHLPRYLPSSMTRGTWTGGFCPYLLLVLVWGCLLLPDLDSFSERLRGTARRYTSLDGSLITDLDFC